MSLSRYSFGQIFNMLILVGAVKMADKIVHEMLGV